MLLVLAASSLALQAAAEDSIATGEGLPAPDGAAGSAPANASSVTTPTLFISEYRVHGAHALSALEIETAVYPFLGPYRTEADVKAACAALEKAYRDKGFGAVSVQYDHDVGKGGVITLEVSEGTVERLRVTGARYFSPAQVKAQAPSLAEGKVINFNDVNHDMVALNQLRDRTVTPTLQPGAEPGTFDIELAVKDSPPVHASAELNNESSPNTTPLRVVASVSDSNLWQSGQGAGASFQVAPQRRQDAEVFTAYYLAKPAGQDRISFLLQGTKQDSNISTLGGTTVAGPGQTLELEAILALPTGTDWSSGKDWDNFYHTLSIGLTYKHYQQTLTPGGAAADSTGSAGTIVTPITYYPVTARYSATLNGLGGKGSSTVLDAGVSLGFRNFGSSPADFDLNRYGADGGFIIFRGDLSHTQPLPGDLQLFAKVQGQLANQPLVSSEEMSGGGLDTVRGYLESETVGDNGAFGTLELRSPTLSGLLGKKIHDWRIYVFGDGGQLTLIDPLPEQEARFDLASIGAGTRLFAGDHLSGSLDAGWPLKSQAYTTAHDVRLTFRAGLDY